MDSFIPFSHGRGQEMTKKRLAAAIMTALTLAVSSPLAFAAEADTVPVDGDGAEPMDTYAIEDTVVTATRVPVTRKEVSSSVEVITRAEIEEQGADNLADALRYATGVQITHLSSGAGRGHKAASIRGFDSRFSTILVDGKRVASEIDQNYELDRIPIDNIDHIEIVRGPSSSVHGTEAMGGVINIITKKSEKPTVSLSGDLSFWSHPGENGPKRYGFFVDSGHIGKFSARLSGFERKSTTAFFKDDGSTYEPYGSWKNFQGTLEYRPSLHETIEFTHSDTKEDTREFFYPNAAKNPLVFAEGYDRIQRHENSISYENKGDDGTGLFLRYYRTVMDKERDNINTKTGQPVGNWRIGKFGWVRAKRTINAFEGHYTWKAGSSHTLTFGGEYRPETFRGTAVRRNGGDFSVTGPMGQVQRGSTYHFYYSALYAEDEWKIDDRWLAFLSLRYDGNNQFDDNVSPKLGLTYAFDDDMRLKFNVAKTFRTPTPNQLYQWNTDNMGNPDLDKEEAFSYDISLEKEWKGKSAKLTFFDNRVKNLIDLQYDASHRWYQYQNIDKAVIRGLEAEYTAEIAPRLDWHTSWMYLDAKDMTTHTSLTNRARNMMTSGLTWRAKSGLTVDLAAQLYDHYRSDPGGEKSFALWNLTVSQNLGEGFTLRLAAENLLNKRDQDMTLPGTLLKATLQYQF